MGNEGSMTTWLILLRDVHPESPINALSTVAINPSRLIAVLLQSDAAAGTLAMAR
ncbi:hypothetical protein D3C79_1111080 [compost metagenome]